MNLKQMLAAVRAQITAKLAERDQHTAAIAKEREALTEDNMELSAEAAQRVVAADAERSRIDAEVAQLRDREAELVREIAADEASERMQNEILALPVETPTARGQVGSEPNPVYRRDDPSVSFFRDLVGATRGERAAQDRLAASQERAGQDTTAGTGGEFAPPAWLVEDFVAYARAGRVAADLMNRMTLPAGVSSVNLPKVKNGAEVAVTQTQNTTITETTVTTTSVSSGITTISGKQTVSVELLRQSGVPFDRVVLADLAAAYAVALDKQVLNGSGANGQLKGLVSAGTTVTYTSTTPVLTSTSGDSLHKKVVAARTGIEKTVFRPATAIIMNPASWGWIESAVDLNGRPLISAAPTPTINGVGEASNGFTGKTFAGLPVYIDANVDATTTGYIHVVRTDELWLFESAVETASFDATLAAQNSVLFRVLGFAAFIGNRLDYAASVVSGSGVKAATV